MARKINLVRGEGLWWSHSNPPGAMGALIPDHVYHSMGMGGDACFAKAVGCTVDSEVAVLLGCVRGGRIGTDPQADRVLQPP